MNTTFAQGVRGCLVGNVLYTQPSGKGLDYFDRSPGNFTSKCGFRRVGNTSNCRLYNSGPKDLESSYTLYPDAASSGWAEVANCPVDNDIWMLFIPVSLISIFKLPGTRQLITNSNKGKVYRKQA
ncbi:hypothetical protein GJU39_17990 [Pedobacter petrophilus]|uniref:Uncharacterized protein n=2 Tax=Pedobacter petrophilus TaxID=1908241 RepID=A0A7K0G3K8_9SPHI|nr:hypothetical protein [Pedobacter petrophilus]MRX77974.1 hypothetical protein [Pedobacter petrophilus]